eukprot:353116-Chlamydomonas_euryale.AAC.5
MLRRARRVTPSRTARVAAVSVVTRCGVSVVVKYLEALLLCVSPHAIAVGRSPPPPRPTLNPKPSTARPPHTCFARTLASPHAVAVGRACRAAAALPLPVLLTVERLIASRGAGGAAARAGRGGAGHHVRSCAGAALELHNARDNTVWSTCVHANVAIASPAWKLVAVAHLQIPSRWQRQRKMLAWPGARVARCLVAAQCGGRAAGATAARAGTAACGPVCASTRARVQLRCPGCAPTPAQVPLLQRGHPLGRLARRAERKHGVQERVDQQVVLQAAGQQAFERRQRHLARQRVDAQRVAELQRDLLRLDVPVLDRREDGAERRLQRGLVALGCPAWR